MSARPMWYHGAPIDLLNAVATDPNVREPFRGDARAELDRRTDALPDMHRLDFTRGTVEPIDPAIPPKGYESLEGTALDALKAAERAKGAHDRLTDIIGYLVDQAEQDDVDGAEWDAALRRKLAQDLAKRFA